MAHLPGSMLSFVNRMGVGPILSFYKRDLTTETIMRTQCISLRILGGAAVLALSIACLAGAQGQQQPMEGKTAEQVYKNIQVFKGTPAEQITPTMRVIARDLGVTCEFCHEEADRSADSLETKETARSMIAMMRDINKNSFGGNQQVTCVTCHNGHSDPVNIPTLPPFAVAVLGPGDEVKAPMLPTVDQVLAKFVQALGGEQALRGVSSMVVTGTRQGYNPGAAALPPAVPIERYWKAPGLSVTIAHPANGVNSNGFDGTAAWTQDARGRVTQVAGIAASRIKRDADFYWVLNLKQQYQRMTVTGTEKIGDHDAYAVVAVPQGESPEWFYFDKLSGLLLRHQVLSPSAVGNVPMATDYDSYRDAGNGIKLPFVIQTVGPSRPDCVLITVDKVQLNAAIDNSKFAKPESKTP
jgi:hypothetical protein